MESSWICMKMETAFSLIYHLLVSNLNTVIDALFAIRRVFPSKEINHSHFSGVTPSKIISTQVSSDPPPISCVPTSNPSLSCV